MDVIIQSLGFTAGNGLEGYVQEKLQKLSHMSDKIIRADVTLYKGHEKDENACHCNIRLEVPGNDHIVKKTAGTFERAVLDTVDVLQQQLRKTKD